MKKDTPISMIGGEYPMVGDGLGDDIGDEGDIKRESSRIYNHPMIKPANPNKYGTHQVVTSAGIF